MPQLSAPAREGLAVAIGVTAAVGLIAGLLPERWHTTLVGFTFLAATWALVWRKDDKAVRHAGLALGGLVIPGPIDPRDLARAIAVAAAWAVGLLAVVAVPFYFGWRAWFAHFMPQLTFSLAVRPGEAFNEVLGQFFVIALPEEAFYRGYLQSRLDDAWAPRWNLLGARVGPGWLVAAVVFALGHVVTVHSATRLAVFFPALVFGWLRARTRGIGAGATFHMLCNVYSMTLGRGFGVY
jgi:membrane protease YdiL (CAAX protease family)